MSLQPSATFAYLYGVLIFFDFFVQPFDGILMFSTMGLLDGQVNQLLGSLLVGEQSARLDHLPDSSVEPCNRIGRIDQRTDLRPLFVYRSPLNPQQDPELPAQFHLVQHGLIPAPGHIFLSKAPRRLPEIVSAEERSRTWDAHQVNKAELIVLPMDWLSKKQSGRVVPTAIGLGMANLTMD